MSGTAADRLRLAEEFLQLAQQETDAVARYLLLRAAAKLAAAANDISTVRQAIDQLDGQYEIDGLRWHVSAWTQLSHAPAITNDHDQLRSLTEYGVRIVDDSIEADRFDQLDRISHGLLGLNDSMGDMELREVVRKRLQMARHLASAYGQLTTAGEGGHDRASPEMGKYYCLLKGDWQKGLPLLAQNSDAQLAQAAQADIRASANAGARKTAGDQWYSLLQRFSQPSLEYQHVAERALYWYSRVLPAVTGLDRREVEQRRASLAVFTTAPTGGSQTRAALRLTDEYNFFPIPKEIIADIPLVDLELVVTECKGSYETRFQNEKSEAPSGESVVMLLPQFENVQIHVRLTTQHQGTGIEVMPKFIDGCYELELAASKLSSTRSHYEGILARSRRKLAKQLATRDQLVLALREMKLLQPRSDLQRAYKAAQIQKLSGDLATVNQSIDTLSKQTIPRQEKPLELLPRAEGFLDAWPGDLQIHCRVVARHEGQKQEIWTAVIGNPNP